MFRETFCETIHESIGKERKTIITYPHTMSKPAQRKTLKRNGAMSVPFCGSPWCYSDFGCDAVLHIVPGGFIIVYPNDDYIFIDAEGNKKLLPEEMESELMKLIHK